MRNGLKALYKLLLRKIEVDSYKYIRNILNNFGVLLDNFTIGEEKYAESFDGIINLLKIGKYIREKSS